MKTLSFNDNAGTTISYLTDLIDDNEQFTVLQVTSIVDGVARIGLTPELIRDGRDLVEIGRCYMLREFKDYAIANGLNLVEASEEHPDPIYLVDNRGPVFEVLSVSFNKIEYEDDESAEITVVIKNTGAAGSITLDWILQTELSKIEYSEGQSEVLNMATGEEREVVITASFGDVDDTADADEEGVVNIEALITNEEFGIHSVGISKSRGCTPRNLTVVDITGGIRLTWEAGCTSFDGHEIWASVDGAAYALIDTVASPTLTYDDTTDYLGVEVAYKIRSYKGTSYSNFTAEEEITLDPDILDLAAVWAEDHAVMTWDGVTGWETEIYESRDNLNWTLVTTVAAGTETYLNHTWQGTQVYFRARAKNGATYGAYCASINIAQTPLVYKFDSDPVTVLSYGRFGLPAGKTVRVTWITSGGLTGYNDITLNNEVVSNFTNIASDPIYVQMAGDLNSITDLSNYNGSNLKLYGDLSKWVLPTGLTKLYLYSCAYTGDISGWVLPVNLTHCRIHDNAFTGDLSSWVIATSGATVMWLGNTDAKNEFTGIPRGNIHQVEASTAGLYMRHCNVNTAGVDAWLAWANAFLATNTPVRNSLFYLAGTGMGVPTGGNNNADRLGIIAKYTAAGFTATVTTAT